MVSIEETPRLEELLALNRVVHGWHVGAFPALFRGDSDNEFREYFSRCLKNPRMRHFVAREGEQAVGFTQAELRELPSSPFRRAYPIVNVNVIVVDPRRHRRGVGRLLIERVRAFARDQGVGRLELDHWEGNPAAAFFRAVGFQPYRHYLCATSEE